MLEDVLVIETSIVDRAIKTAAANQREDDVRDEMNWLYRFENMVRHYRELYTGIRRDNMQSSSPQAYATANAYGSSAHDMDYLLTLVQERKQNLSASQQR